MAVDPASYAEALAGRHSRPTLPTALSITGQNNSTIANVVIEPTRPFDQNTFMSPPEPTTASRNPPPARWQTPNPKVNGPKGCPFSLKTNPTTPKPASAQTHT